MAYLYALRHRVALLEMLPLEATGWADFSRTLHQRGRLLGGANCEIVMSPAPSEYSAAEI